VNRYQCEDCGKEWYSAASLEHLAKPYCEECGGELKHETTDETD
jgi:predicted nucleic acid-binding Zn ribbon protein